MTEGIKTMKVSRGSQKLHREKVYVYEEAIQGREKPLGTLPALTHYQKGPFSQQADSPVMRWDAQERLSQ